MSTERPLRDLYVQSRPPYRLAMSAIAATRISSLLTWVLSVTSRVAGYGLEVGQMAIMLREEMLCSPLSSSVCRVIRKIRRRHYGAGHEMRTYETSRSKSSVLDLLISMEQAIGCIIMVHTSLSWRSGFCALDSGWNSRLGWCFRCHLCSW
jgi:hypothetical protein